MRTALLLAILALGCDRRPDRVEPSCDQEPMAAWLLACIEKANPHSDEEPEDMVDRCERAAVRLFCGPRCFLTLGGSVACIAPIDGGAR